MGTLGSGMAAQAAVKVDRDHDQRVVGAPGCGATVAPAGMAEVTSAF